MQKRKLSMGEGQQQAYLATGKEKRERENSRMEISWKLEVGAADQKTCHQRSVSFGVIWETILLPEDAVVFSIPLTS